VRGLSGPRFHDVDLDVRPGEIVGLAGVEGNGQREFLRALAGLVRTSGSVTLAGRKVTLGDPGRVQRAGIVHLPGDRHAEGVLLPLSVRENTSLLALAKVARAGVVQRRSEAEMVSGQIRQLDVRTPGMETPISALSGGNQQKVLFARSLLAEPTLLLADEPTRGVDANARLELYQVMRRVAQAGQAVIVVSSDVVELQGLCDRVIVFSRGHAVRTLEGDDISEENITGTAITSDTQRAEGAARRRSRLVQWRRFGAGDYLPTAVLAVLIAALTTYTAASNDFFLSRINFVGMLLLASALGFIAIGQLIVMLTGGIDLSVGPLTGLVVVVLSFFAGQGQSDARLWLGILAVIGTALAVGLVNAALVRVVRLAPVLATLATYIVLQGISLLLRGTPGGFYRPGVTSTIKTAIGWVPVAFLIVAATALACEGALRWTRYGLALRAVGSDATRSHRLGAHVTITQVSAYVLCSLFTAAGGIMLASQVAIGDPSVGLNYTLTSITAVVLGGASIFGGRGSFIGAFCGAVLIQEIVTSTTFLQIGTEWQYYLPGILILAGAGVYSRTRQLGPSAGAPEPAPASN
jgi:ribose transport system ATP-binding protein